MSPIDWRTGHAIMVSLPTTHVAGSIVVLGDLVGVFPNGHMANELGKLFLTGSFVHLKRSGAMENMAIGDRLYYDAPNAWLTKMSGARPLVGHCVTPAAAADTMVRVRLKQ